MNRLTSFKYFLLLFVLCGLVYGCKKDEGPGGTSTIKGKVVVYEYDSGFLNPAPSFIYPATDEKTFIIYGTDHTTYDDDYDTSFDGTYEFKHLQKGKYRIFAYSKDSTGASNFMISGRDTTVFVEVEINSNGSTVVAPDLIILDSN